MKVEKKVTIKGNWVKVKEDINTGDIIEIRSAGEIVKGNFGDRSVFKIQTNTGEKLLSFNQTTMNYLIDGFGTETEKWVGRSVKVWIVRENVGGKFRNIVYLTPPNWVEGDDAFYPPANKSVENDGIPVIDDSEGISDSPDDIDPESIPF